MRSAAARIAILTTQLHGGGAEMVTRRWARELTIRGYGATICLLSSSHDDASAWVPPGVAIRCQEPGERSVTKDVLWARAACADADVVLCLLTYPNLIGLAALGHSRRHRIVISERNVPSVLLPTEGMSGRTKLYAARLLYRHADGVIAISHPVAADLAATFRIREDRLWVVPNPVLDCASDTGPTTTSSVRAAFVGRLMPEKAPERFVLMLKALRHRGLDASGVVFGEGPLRPRLAAMIEQEGIDCVMRGWVEDWWTEDVTCVVLPSIVEGFGNVLIEAAAHGIPVVTPSQALGVGDAILPGVTGVFALSGRPQHLADAVEMTASLSDLGWRGWYSSANSASRLAGVIETVIHDDGMPSPIASRAEVARW